MSDVSKFNIDGTQIDVKDVTARAPTFVEASIRTNINSGESQSTLFGKIKKWFSDLKTVAFTGSYNDLTDVPPAAAVNNGQLTIQKNGTNVQTFTANQASNATANITVPTKVSELTNDSGYTTNTGTVTQVKVGTTAYNPSSGVVSLPAYPTVNNATLTIQKNGTNVQTFTANQGSNATANIACANVPHIADTSTSGGVAVPAQTFKSVASVSVPACQGAIIVASIKHSSNGVAVQFNISETANVSSYATQDVTGLRAYDVNAGCASYILTASSSARTIYLNVWAESAITVNVNMLRALYF